MLTGEKACHTSSVNGSVQMKSIWHVSLCSALNGNQELIENVHREWKIRNYVKPGAPSTGARTSSAQGLSATVGALICLAVMIGVGGIVMIIILIR